MKNPFSKIKCAAFCLAAYLCLVPFTAGAESELTESLVALHLSPYVVHYDKDTKHNKYPWFVALEYESASRWEVGGAFFKNSYYQPCGYIYGGKRWIFGPRQNHLFLKITAGAIIGYFEPYENKLPVNANGIGLGIIPAIGYKYKRSSTQFVLLGTSGFLITLGYDIFK
ncbi:MAG TPA: hypothetical protein PLI53_10435 [Geobacteraceae bacterium]|nr:hypothetical protein [Geobacteraceae bacterium]